MQTWASQLFSIALVSGTRNKIVWGCSQQRSVLPPRMQNILGGSSLWSCPELKRWVYGRKSVTQFFNWQLISGLFFLNHQHVASRAAPVELTLTDSRLWRLRCSSAVSWDAAPHHEGQGWPPQAEFGLRWGDPGQAVALILLSCGGSWALAAQNIHLCPAAFPVSLLPAQPRQRWCELERVSASFV